MNKNEKSKSEERHDLRRMTSNLKLMRSETCKNQN
jgi:hypothetical protein